MSDDEWNAVEMVLEECYAGAWGVNTGRAYRIMLDDFAPVQIIRVLRAFIKSKFRPSIGELLERLTADPTRPTWTEVFEAIYGRRGVLAVRGPRSWESEQDRIRQRDAAALERARADFHPLIAAFVEMMTPGRLMELGVGDEDWGDARREQLRKEWVNFEARAEERQAYGLPLVTAGRRHELGRFNPAGALGGPARQLASGDDH